MAFDSNHGQCKFCGSKLVENPKTGKIFCSEKCWLKKAPQQINQPTGYPTPNPTPNTHQNANSGLTEALQKISNALQEIKSGIENNRTYLDQILAKVDDTHFTQSEDVKASGDVDIKNIPF